MANNDSEVSSVDINDVKDDLRDNLEMLIELRQSAAVVKEKAEEEIKQYSSLIGEVLNQLGVRKVTGLPWTPTWTSDGFSKRLDTKKLLNFVSAGDLESCYKKTKRAGFLTVRKSE
jgi:hypothetical protein